MTAASSPHLRFAGPEDEPFIFNSWLRSFKKSNDLDRSGLPGWMFWRYYHPIIEQVLHRAETRVLCDQDRPDFIFGWICYEKTPTFTVIHYLYVKNAFRKLGLARKMTDSAEISLEQVVFTFTSHVARDLATAKCEVATFLPVDQWLDPQATTGKGKKTA